MHPLYPKFLGPRAYNLSRWLNPLSMGQIEGGIQALTSKG
jgi:hypothetical protein